MCGLIIVICIAVTALCVCFVGKWCIRVRGADILKIRGLCRLTFCCSLAVVFIVVDTCYVGDVLLCCEVMCFWYEEGLQMHDFTLNGLVMTAFLLLVVLLTVGDSWTGCFRTGCRFSLHWKDFICAGFTLECPGGCDGLEMWQCLKKEINGRYVVSGAVVLATLMFDHIAVRLGCFGNDRAWDIVIAGSFWAQEAMSCHALVLVGSWSHAFGCSALFCYCFSLSGNLRHPLSTGVEGCWVSHLSVVEYLLGR